MKLSLLLLAVLACQAFAAPPRGSSILKTLQTKKSATVIVSVTASNLDGLRRAFQLQTFATRSDKLNAFYSLFKGHADSTQVKILSLLAEVKAEKPIVFRQLWMSNKIVVKEADYETVEKLLALNEVEDVREERIFPLEEPINKVVFPDGEVPNAGEQWGVVMIGAPAVHASGNTGEGAVIGTIDTGVRVTHEALKDGHRASYGWFDPSYFTAEPNDQNGHGTHTAGTIAGRANGIGVAPGAQWIACKGCQSSSCSESDLLKCGEWHACPTDTEDKNPDCSKAANAVSNSWGGGQGDDWYDHIIKGWMVIDIAPFFSIGNSGPYCGSANSPGDSIDAIAVGSTTSNNGLSDFSSVGPTYRGHRIKPEVSAPGSDVVSSYYLSDTSYSSLSGTSMACPHVAGASALLYSKNPKLSYAQVKALLADGAEAINSTGENCGDIPETTYPNHHAGAGRINIANSVQRLNAMMK